jgi:hypothetical protein
MNMTKLTTVGLIAGVALGLSGVLTVANAATTQTLPEGQQKSSMENQSSGMEHQSSGMEHQKNMKTNTKAMHKKVSHEFNKSMKPKSHEEPSGQKLIGGKPGAI